MERLSNFSDNQALVDYAEELRREGRLQGALEAVERCLCIDPVRHRALLVQSRIFYQGGMLAQALDIVKKLQGLLGGDERIARIAEGLAELWQQPKPSMERTFVTETMADLHVRQGYLWDAMEIYRRLYADSGREELWRKILALKDRLQAEGQNTQDEWRERLEVLNQWIQKHQRDA